MLTQKKAIDILRKKYPYLKDNFGVKKIGLFGSYARGAEGKNSDVDILIEFEKPIGLKFIELTDYMEKLLSRKVDILTPEGVKSIRLKKVAEEIKKSLLYV